MLKMQSCCIRGCDSYKEAGIKNIGYFKFPLNDILLLKKWLKQINYGNWKPSEASQICSSHFRKEDLDAAIMNKKYPSLLPFSVPTIFPVEKKGIRKRKIEQEGIIGLKEISAIKIQEIKSHRDKISLLRKKPNVNVNEKGKEKKFTIHSNLINISINKQNADSSSSVNLINSQKPLLRITINGKSNVPTSSSKTAPFETIFLPYHGEKKIANNETVEVKNKKVCGLEDNPNSVQKNLPISDHSAYGKSLISDIAKDRSNPRVKQYINKSKLKNNPSPQIDKQFRSRNVSQDHIYSCPPGLKVESLDMKARGEKDELRRRLGELREKRKREQSKIVRLQNDLRKLEKKMKEKNNEEEIVLPDLGGGGKPPGVGKSSWLIREKEEYENLLKDVREIKLKELKKRHDQELGKIKTLQTQMTNLRKKMMENDEKEMALYSVKESNNLADSRLDWMKREEEEYEKLLEDVRKIKQSYKLRKLVKKESDSNMNNKSIKCERVLSHEECTIIERMQEKSRNLKEEFENYNKPIYKIEPNDDDDGYGEVIGEIDEDSIKIDICKEETILIFNEELPDPGLLDS